VPPSNAYIQLIVPKQPLKVFLIINPDATL